MNTKRTFWTALVMLALTAGNNYAKEKADASDADFIFVGGSSYVVADLLSSALVK